MTRKIICLLLAFMLACSAAVFSDGYTDVSGSEYEREIEILTAIGIVSGFNGAEFIPEMNVTRGEFCKTVMNIIGASSSDKVYFTDVPESYYAFREISYAYSGGIMKGYGDGTFRPDKEITLGEAAKTLITLMNYTYKTDGTLHGAVAAARQLKILNGVNKAHNAPITRGEMCRIILNALKVDLPVLTAVSGRGLVYEIVAGKTLLTEYLNMDMGEGIVEANELISLKNKPLALPGEIKVNGISFRIRSLADMDMVGTEVFYVYTLPENEGEAGEIVYISPEEPKVAEITSDSFLRFSENVVYYENEEGEEKKIKLSDTADIFYNGEAKVFSEDMFDETVYGRFRFLSTDGSSEYDVVFIEEYEIYIAGNIRADEKTIRDYDDPGRKLDLSDENIITVIYDEYGNIKSFADIAKKQVLSVCAGENIIKVYVNTGIITDTITHITEKGLAGEKAEYKLSGLALERKGTVKPGGNYILYADALGNICWFEEELSAANEYVYIVKAADGDAVGGKPMLIKGYHYKNGMNTYETSDTFIINGAAYRNITVSKLTELIGITETVTDEEGNESTKTTVSQLVTAEFDENGKIMKINTAKQYSEIENTDYNGFTRITENGKSYTFYNEDSKGPHFSYIMYFKSSTPVIMVPENPDTATDEDYETATPSRFTNFSSYPVTAYTATPDGEYADILVSRKIAAKVGENSRIATVVKLVSVVNEDGEKADKLYTLSGNTEKTALSDKEGNVTYTYDGVTYRISDLDRGDTIVYATNADGYISSFVVLYDASEDKYMSPSTNDETNTRLSNRFVMTEITGISENFYRVKSLGNDSEFRVALRTFNGYAVVRRNSAGFLVNKGVNADADIGDKLLIQYASRVPYNVVLIKKYN